MARNELSELMQYEEIRHGQSVRIITAIHALPITMEWKKIFSNMCTGRTWYGLSKTQQSQMVNIAEVNSQAVKFLIAEHRKKTGLAKMEKISVLITDEVDRQKAMMAILEKGAKEAKKDIDLLVSKSKVVNE